MESLVKLHTTHELLETLAVGIKKLKKILLKIIKLITRI